jgi:hypothetical protein
MDTHIADEKLKELHVEESTVKANDRSAEAYEIDPEAEKRLLRKLDWRVVPMLWFLYMLAFLDRTNIGTIRSEDLDKLESVLIRVVGNAKIQGMTKDLKMTGNDYNVALFLFFPSYIIFEVPSNIIIKRVAPSTWLAGIMFFWGVITIGQGLVTTKEGLYAMRFLLGFFEAGKRAIVWKATATDTEKILCRLLSRLHISDQVRSRRRKLWRDMH